MCHWSKKKKKKSDEESNQTTFPSNESGWWWKLLLFWSVSVQVAQMVYFDWAAFTHCTFNLKARRREKSAVLLKSSHRARQPGGYLEWQDINEIEKGCIIRWIGGEHKGGGLRDLRFGVRKNDVHVHLIWTEEWRGKKRIGNRNISTDEPSDW